MLPKAAFLLGAAALVPGAAGALFGVSFSLSAQRLQAYDFVEVTLRVEGPDALTPFTDVVASGQFGQAHQSPLRVDGFYDSADGSVFRVRFMPAPPGDCAYSIAFRQLQFERVHRGSFHVAITDQCGSLHVNPQYPWQRVWETSAEQHF